MPFPKLSIITEISNYFKNVDKNSLKETFFVCVLHVLESNGTMFKALLDLGAKPEHFFVCGKFYSTHLDTLCALQNLGITTINHVKSPKSWRYTKRIQEEMKLLWDTVVSAVSKHRPRQIVILDDGGFGLRTIPRTLCAQIPVIGIEQTKSGLTLRGLPKNIPLIHVASSATKKVLEPPLIARAVATRTATKENIITTETVIGVSGIGSIGSAIRDYWRSQGNKVIVFDKNKVVSKRSILRDSDCMLASTEHELLSKADVLFGCTGVNFLHETKWSNFLHNKTDKQIRLISCSSRDIEFLSALEYYYSKVDWHYADLLGTHNFSINQLEIIIQRGGYPINFSGNSESVPNKEIQLTRGLMMIGIIQALELLRKGEYHNGTHVPLDACLQNCLVNKWFAEEPDLKSNYTNSIVANFNDIEWIKFYSK